VQAIGELYNEKHDYKTVVIDTLDWLERLVWSDVCREKNVKSIEDIGYAKGYTFALYQWRTILSGLDALRNERDMTILLLAHCKVERFEHPETDPFDRWAPRLHKHASAMIQEWCSEVLFASYKVHTKSTDNGFNRKRVQGIGTGERIVRTQERPAHVAKNRLGLPLEVPLTWKAITTNHQNHATE
ncbi:MAG: oxidoreductase, partial [Deltaproteobacteria bacterium]